MNADLLPGYTPLHEIGRGASGRVMLARHDESGEVVAVKQLHDDLYRDPAFVARFRTEARLLATVADPHVVRLLEYVETDRGAAIVMQAVNGVSLRAMLRAHGPTDPEAALCVLHGSLLGLAAAHSAGVVHRDYKPENVLVDDAGTSLLVDFGVARPVSRSADGAGGGPADIVGTPAYLAPELWRAEPPTEAADVYAATATFVECVTGSPPYPGDDLTLLRLAHENAPVPDLDLPEPIGAVIRRGLAKRSDRRPTSAADFVTEVERAAEAAYGPDWQRRGKERLAQRAALLAALLPSALPAAIGGTVVATTILRRQLPDRSIAGAPSPSRPGGQLYQTGQFGQTGRQLYRVRPWGVLLVPVLVIVLGLCAVGYGLASPSSGVETQAAPPTTSDPPAARIYSPPTTSIVPRTPPPPSDVQVTTSAPPPTSTSPSKAPPPTSTSPSKAPPPTSTSLSTAPPTSITPSPAPQPPSYLVTAYHIDSFVFTTAPGGDGYPVAVVRVDASIITSGLGAVTGHVIFQGGPSSGGFDHQVRFDPPFYGAFRYTFSYTVPISQLGYCSEVEGRVYRVLLSASPANPNTAYDYRILSTPACPPPPLG